MSEHRRDSVKSKKGFSLIELLIVILIVSIVYFLGFEGIEMGKNKPKALTPLNLKENIVSSELFMGQSTLLCTNKCRSCYLRRGISSPFRAYKSPIQLNDITVYTIDKSDSLVEMEYGRFQDKKVCLIMNFYNNGSSTQLIIEDDKSVYFLPSFFGQPKEFSAIEDAKEYWLRHSGKVSNSGDFY